MNNKKNKGEFVLSGWHMKKEVTIGQLVTLLAFLISGLWWASSVETRMVYSKTEDRRIEEKMDIIISDINEKFNMYQKDISKALGKIDRSIGKLGDKLDRKVDR